ncbi:MAG: hypothetical protein ACKV2T_15635 [Kofleriaceae bacterium]
MLHTHTIALALLVGTVQIAFADDASVSISIGFGLADLDPNWRFHASNEGARFARAESAVTVTAVANCDGYDLVPRATKLEVFRENVAAPGQFCLQLRDHAVLVDIDARRELRRSIDPVRDVEALRLVQAIGDRLRPPVEIPALGISIRPHLFVEPTDDGFVAFGSAASRFVASDRRGTCGMVEREATSFSPGPWDMPKLLGTADRLELCLERADDAVVITIFDPVFAPPSPGTTPIVEAKLAHLIHSIANSLPIGPRPRIFGSRSSLALPNAAFDLRGAHGLGRGWMTADYIPEFKLVDGAAWDEPNADVLLPIKPYAFAVVVRREACVGQKGASPFVPPEVALVEADGGRYRVRACIGGTITASVLPVGERWGSNDPERMRAVITAIARSRGVRVKGRELHYDLVAVASVPWYVSEAGDSRWGLALRASSSIIVGRPFGLLVLAGFGVGGANDDYHPDLEEHAAPEEVHADLVFELFGGVGGALTLGPLTLGAGFTLHADVSWPGERDIYRAVGLAAFQIGDNTRLEARTSFGIAHRGTTHEVSLKAGPFMAMARTTDLLETSGTRGFEIGIGLDSRIGDR